MPYAINLDIREASIFPDDQIRFWSNKFQCPQKTVYRWRNAGAPLESQEEMGHWLLTRKQQNKNVKAYVGERGLVEYKTARKVVCPHCECVSFKKHHGTGTRTCGADACRKFADAISQKKRRIRVYGETNFRRQKIIENRIAGKTKTNRGMSKVSTTCVWCGSVQFLLGAGRGKKNGTCSHECRKIAKYFRSKKRHQREDVKVRARARAKAFRDSGRGKLADIRKRGKPEYRQWLKRHRKKPHVRLRNRVQRAIRAYAVNRRGRDRGTPLTIKLTGCSMKFLQSHLEGQWERWMNWSNYGTRWVIDHIVPIASFDMSKEGEQKKAFHWTNLRPLERRENLEKSDNIIPCQPELLLEFA